MGDWLAMIATGHKTVELQLSEDDTFISGIAFFW
jgi:hypothetical protein